MAKQAGDIFIEGTIDDLTYYKMEGKYYVRIKSSLTAKKFWKSKAFERSRESCKRFSEGNKTASKIYQSIESGKRNYKLFCFLKKKAIQLLKEGNGLADTETILLDYVKQFGFVTFNKAEIVNSVAMHRQSVNSVKPPAQKNDHLFNGRKLFHQNNKTISCSRLTANNSS